MVRLIVLATIPLLAFPLSSTGQEWSFAVISDIHQGVLSYRNALREIRNSATDTAECLLVSGDLGCARRRYRRYLSVFGNASRMKAFFPVRGTHESRLGARYMARKILPEQDGVYRDDSGRINYYVDWRNARFIVLDQYSGSSRRGCIDEGDIQWTRECIETAKDADHVFVLLHDPPFVRYRHVGESFDACPQQRNAFWNMLLAHRNKVRAVLAGHTHCYYRVRVANPASAQADHSDAFPDEPGGIHLVDCGALGRSAKSTVVRVRISGGAVTFLVLQAERGISKPYSAVDKWSIPDPGAAPAGPAEGTR